jgi:hypothetical protein
MHTVGVHLSSVEFVRITRRFHQLVSLDFSNLALTDIRRHVRISFNASELAYMARLPLDESSGEDSGPTVGISHVASPARFLGHIVPVEFSWSGHCWCVEEQYTAT